MPNFNNDVVIIDHDLLLETGGGGQVVHVAQSGNVVVRRDIDDVLTDILSFEAATGELRLGAANVAGDLLIAGTGGDPTVILNGGDGRLRLGATGTHGDFVILNSAGTTVLTYQASTGELIVGAPRGRGSP